MRHVIALRELPTRSDRRRFRDLGQRGILMECRRRSALTVQLTDTVLHLSRVRSGPASPKDGLMVRPQYLEDYGVPPPSQTQQARSTVKYRCYRLIGLSNLYYWAVSWCVHAANDWKLGEPAYSFDLREKQLWSLGLETLMEVAKCGFVYGDSRITVKQRDLTMREGVVLSTSIRWGQSQRYLNVTAETGDDTDSEPPAFIGDDRVLAIKSPQDPESVPMALICTRLRRAYINAAADLREAGITWTAPPFFKGFERWEDLAKDMEIRGTDPGVVLQDLEERRRQVVANVEHVLMVNAQDEHEDEESEAVKRPLAASSSANSSKKIPRNPDIYNLCIKLRRELPKGEMQIDIALNFTGQNLQKAKSMLAQCRRFRHLWDPEQ